MFSFLKTQKKKTKHEHDTLDIQLKHKPMHSHKLPPTTHIHPPPPPTPTCEHIIIQDYIDINTDRSQMIYYCKICLSTFEQKNNHFILQYENSDTPPFY